MAKITARGDRELKRYKHQDGRLMVVTERGRLLRKLTPTSGYTLLSRCTGGSVAHFIAHADAVATAHGYVEA